MSNTQWTNYSHCVLLFPSFIVIVVYLKQKTEIDIFTEFQIVCTVSFFVGYPVIYKTTRLEKVLFISVLPNQLFNT